MAQFSRAPVVTLTGATPVTLVSAPGASARKVYEGGIAVNKDSVNQTFIVSFVEGGTPTEIGRVTITTLLSGPLPGAPFVLEATDESITVELTGAHTTTAPTAVAAIFEEP
ncbi:MAG TPA: hypothetical protein VM487_10095 [Phycisphaerae bacterium]|nr:hypothetical protein [Phycisphaerae bacterium]